ncbi:MAG: hypothetical protein KDA77_00120 [Planctomycetaceae bacterium]|nr:hypothetical protein [Planctomycetaceae bacterium]
MTLNSSNTLDDIIAAYADNASYAEDDSVTKARAFVTACNILILKLPAEQTNGESTTKISTAELRRLKDEAQTWLNKKGSGTSYSVKYKHADFTDFRS